MVMIIERDDARLDLAHLRARGHSSTALKDFHGED
jgi:hypothetical protein